MKITESQLKQITDEEIMSMIENGEIDEGVSKTFYIDEDEDGYGSPDITMEGCSLPIGYVDNQEDCNDTDTLINPSENEYCDTVDNNCDGIIDENYSVDATLFYADVDGDSFGNEESSKEFQSSSFYIFAPLLFFVRSEEELPQQTLRR